MNRTALTQLREAPFRALTRDEGTNSVGVFAPGERKAASGFKVGVVTIRNCGHKLTAKGLFFYGGRVKSSSEVSSRFLYLNVFGVDYKCTTTIKSQRTAMSYSSSIFVRAITNAKASENVRTR